MILSEENKHTNLPSTLKINPQVKMFSFKEKEAFKDSMRREQAHKCICLLYTSDAADE